MLQGNHFLCWIMHKTTAVLSWSWCLSLFGGFIGYFQLLFHPIDGHLWFWLLFWSSVTLLFDVESLVFIVLTVNLISAFTNNKNTTSYIPNHFLSLLPVKGIICNLVTFTINKCTKLVIFFSLLQETKGIKVNW